MSTVELWVSFYTILTRELRRFMRIWVQTMVPSVITAALYFLIFGTLIGERIGPIAGVSYAQFVAPGLIMLAAITNAYGNTVSSFFGSKFQNSIEELLVSPTPSIIVLSGYVLGGAVRGTLVGGLVWILSIVFVEMQIHNLLLIISIVVLTTILFSLLGLLNAVYANTFDDISIVPTFLLAPLIYLGGVFYSVEMLPPLWESISAFNPILYMVDALRYGFLGSSDFSPSTAYSVAIFLIVLMFTLNLYLLTNSKRLRN